MGYAIDRIRCQVYTARTFDSSYFKRSRQSARARKQLCSIVIINSAIIRKVVAVDPIITRVPEWPSAA